MHSRIIEIQKLARRQKIIPLTDEDLGGFYIAFDQVKVNYNFQLIL